jgi:hypothetical protein
MGRPPDLVKAKLEEIHARLVLGNSDRIMKRMMDAIEDPDHPSHTTMLKFFGDRLFNMEDFSGQTKAPSRLSVVITDAEGRKTEVVSGGGSAEETEELGVHPIVLDMGDADEVEPDAN